MVGYAPQPASPAEPPQAVADARRSAVYVAPWLLAATGRKCCAGGRNFGLPSSRPFGAVLRFKVYRPQANATPATHLPFLETLLPFEVQKPLNVRHLLT